MRSLARLLVGLRFVIPVIWIAAAVLATLALPPLGATGSAPLDDLVADGGGAATQRSRSSLARARERAGGRDIGDRQMHEYVSSVLRTLAEASPDDLAYVRAQLSEDYVTP